MWCSGVGECYTDIYWFHWLHRDNNLQRCSRPMVMQWHKLASLITCECYNCVTIYILIISAILSVICIGCAIWLGLRTGVVCFNVKDSSSLSSNERHTSIYYAIFNRLLLKVVIVQYTFDVNYMFQLKWKRRISHVQQELSGSWRQRARWTTQWWRGSLEALITMFTTRITHFVYIVFLLLSSIWPLLSLLISNVRAVGKKPCQCWWMTCLN